MKAESPVDAFAWLGVSVLDQVRMQRIERAAMGDQGDVLLRASQYFIEHDARACHEVAACFPAGRGEIEFPGAPAGHDLRMINRAVVHLASFEKAEGQLPQPGIRLDPQAEGGAERSGRVEGPGQITADEAGDGAAGQPRGGLLRLALPALVERRVEVTHGEALFVVVGFAVAYEVKRFHGYLPRPCLPRGDSL